MDSQHVNMPLRGGKKMRKRKELDALVANSSVAKRGPAAAPVAAVNKRGHHAHDQLLSDSSEEAEDYWSSVGGGGEKVRCRRKLLMRRRACGALVRACAAVLVFACVVATTTVMWLFIDIREQVTALRTELDQAVAGSQRVPSELQECHSLARELQQNQTSLFNKLGVLAQQLSNYTSQLTTVQYDLTNVQTQLKKSPAVNEPPVDLKQDIASFGSQIKDLNNMMTEMKGQTSHLQDVTNVLSQNVTSLKQSMEKLSNSSQFSYPASKQDEEERRAMQTTISQLSTNLSTINDTLNKKLQWVVDDQLKDRKKIDMLSDGNQNISARLTTVEGDYVKLSVQENLQAAIAQLSNKVNSTDLQLSNYVSLLSSNYTDLSKIVKNVQDSVRELENRPSQLSVAAKEKSSPVSAPPVPAVVAGIAPSQPTYTPADSISTEPQKASFTRS